MHEVETVAAELYSRKRRTDITPRKFTRYPNVLPTPRLGVSRWSSTRRRSRIGSRFLETAQCAVRQLNTSRSVGPLVPVCGSAGVGPLVQADRIDWPLHSVCVPSVSRPSAGRTEHGARTGPVMERDRGGGGACRRAPPATNRRRQPTNQLRPPTTRRLPRPQPPATCPGHNRIQTAKRLPF